MPKPKPDQVIRHEIVLGRSERDLLDSALMAYGFNRVATPTVALLSDVSAMSIVLTALGTYLGFKYSVGSLAIDTTQDLINDFQNQYDAYKQTPEYQQAAGVAQAAAYGAASGVPIIGTPLSQLVSLLFR
tara:strand:- start:19 stop:408 length:390 start_codon:yes stop_codon:yes gene_type:complete